MLPEAPFSPFPAIAMYFLNTVFTFFFFFFGGTNSMWKFVDQKSNPCHRYIPTGMLPTPLVWIMNSGESRVLTRGAWESRKQF